jgi:hypothetical protein
MHLPRRLRSLQPHALAVRAGTLQAIVARI